MKKLISVSVLLLLVAVSAYSQDVFLEHIQSEEQGSGSVIIDQDPRLDPIVDGEEIISTNTVVSKVNRGPAKPGTQTKTASGNRQKMRGFRIQVYYGGNQRADQAAAQRMGHKATAIFPELQCYTSFASPHWRCRVGDFATREEASRYLARLRAANIPDVMVVPSEVYLFQGK